MKIDYIWYKKNIISYLLLPISFIYQFICFLRRRYLQQFKQKKIDVPIIVVGNISVGGVGKTPLVIAIARKCIDRGLKVGIVSRGYGAKRKDYPYQVKASDAPSLVGDEPLLLAMHVNSPVIIDPNRVRAVGYLLDNYMLDVIISDDGMQHYAMPRSIEIAVIDGSRMFANGFCLPSGPLRESPKRLNSVDFVVVNRPLRELAADSICAKTRGAEPQCTSVHEDLGRESTKQFGINVEFSKTFNSLPNDTNICELDIENKNIYQMYMRPGKITRIVDNVNIAVNDINGAVSAVAGIGNPDRFFTTLKMIGIKFKEYKFADHYLFTKEDFVSFAKNVIMTEKDAVKCRDFATDTMYFLPVEAQLPVEFWNDLWLRIEGRNSEFNYKKNC